MRSVLPASLLAIIACTTATPPQSRPFASTPSAVVTTASLAPSNQEINDRFQQQIAGRIADRKDERADQVFQNIQIEWLKSVPASRFLDIMNWGYSRALGVSCLHCHVEQDFASDDKRPKRAAREMAVMHRMINERLRGMQNLEAPPDDRTINCFTCHRGTVDPTKTGS